MDGATKQRLRDEAARLGASLDERAIDKLARYLDLLVQWNQRINLTAVVEPRAIVARHFLDSLAIVPRLGAAKTVLDAGSGAGFPGVVLAVARPELRVTCVESIQKKVAFIQTLKRELAPNVEPIAARLEALPPERTFDVAVSRATWDPAVWVRIGAARVAPGGVVIAMQTLEQAPLEPPAGFTALPALDYTIEGVTRRLAAFRR
jgi:16S rRNA (guanine527-N7)-methyltransferase